jgi:hypothetical protein
VVTPLIVLYALSWAIGAYVVLFRDPGQLTYFLAFVSAVVAIVLPFYLQKSAKENTAGGIQFELAVKSGQQDTTKEGDAI